MNESFYCIHCSHINNVLKDTQSFECSSCSKTNLFKSRKWGNKWQISFGFGMLISLFCEITGISSDLLGFDTDSTWSTLILVVVALPFAVIIYLILNIFGGDKEKVGEPKPYRPGKKASELKSSKTDYQSSSSPPLFSSSGASPKYQIFKNPQNDYKAVKAGWSHPGFFFVVFWCLSKQLWVYAVIISVIGFVFGIMLMDNVILDFIVTLGIMIWMGSEGNELYAKSLKDRGYDYVKIVYAKTPEGAIAQYHKDTKEEKED